MGKTNKTDIVMKQITEYIKTCYKELHLEVPYDIMYGQLDILLKQHRRLNSTFKNRKQIIILHTLACNVIIENFSDWGSLLNKFKSILKELNLNVHNNITLDSLPDVV